MVDMVTTSMLPTPVPKTEAQLEMEQRVREFNRRMNDSMVSRGRREQWPFKPVRTEAALTLDKLMA